MFWLLYLAHLIGDYPLQTDWMVHVKRTWWGLSLHVAVHLLVLLVLVGAARRTLWPYLLLLALLHYIIDTGKNVISRGRPEWVITPYMIDQVLHFISILLVTWWIELRAGPVALLWDTTISIYLIGYLLVSYVWFVSERLFVYADEDYRREVQAQLWPRMLTRTAMLSGLLLGWHFLSMLVFASATHFRLPYLSGPYRRRAFLTDLGVSLVVAIFILLATGRLRP